MDSITFSISTYLLLNTLINVQLFLKNFKIYKIILYIFILYNRKVEFTLDKILAKLDKLIIFLVIYSICFITFFNTLKYTIPFVLALLLAFILQKPTNYLIKRFNLKNSIAALITTSISSAILIILLICGVNALTNEIVLLTKNLQVYVSQNTSKITYFIQDLHKYYKNLDPTIVNTIETNISNFSTKTVSATLNVSGKVMSAILISISYIPYVIMVIIFTLISTYFFTKDFSSAKNRFFDIIPSNKTDRVIHVIESVKKMLGNYCLSYLIIIGITFVETIIAYLILGVNYAILLSIITAVCDILPIIGIGIIYLPIAVIYFINGNYFTAFGLVIAYTLVSVIRQIIEPKIVSSTLGIHPVAALAALFIGLEVNGVSGIFFFMFLIIFYNILKKC